jgi:hypothetical protein
MKSRLESRLRYATASRAEQSAFGQSGDLAIVRMQKITGDPEADRILAETATRGFGLRGYVPSSRAVTGV